MTDPVTPYRLAFEIPALPELPQRRLTHWAVKRAADTWREAVVIAVGRRKPKRPLSRAHLTLIRRSSVEPDYDNLVASFKPVVDGLTRSRPNRKGEIIRRAGVIFDDKPSVIDREYRWEKAPPRHGSIRVEVRGLPDGR